MATSKFDLLRALIDAEVKATGGDAYGWHHLLVAALDECRHEHGSEEELADAIFERIAGALVPAEEDESENQVDQT